MLKKLIPAVVVVLALALTGAASASASTVFCKSAQSPCAAGNSYPAGTTFSAFTRAGSNITVKSPITNLTCPEGKWGGTVTSTGVQISSLTISTCGNSFGTCKIEARNLPWTSTLSAGLAGDGTLTISSATLKFTCTQPGVLPCEVQATNIPLAFHGGAPAYFTINQKFTPVAGSQCISGDYKQIEGQFTVTSPAPAWVETQ
jgi:hypothetical protein